MRTLLVLAGLVSLSLGLDLPFLTEGVVGSRFSGGLGSNLVSIPQANPLFVSCLSNSSLFFSDASTIPPVLFENRSVMAQSGWQTFNCSVIPQPLTFTASRRIMEVPNYLNMLYVSATKRVFSYLYDSAQVSSAFDICTYGRDSGVVMSWNDSNVQGQFFHTQSDGSTD